MKITRRQLILSGGLTGGYFLLSVPAEAGIGAFFLRMLGTLAKTFPPVLFSRYLQHSVWQKPLTDVYTTLFGNGYLPSANVQTTGPSHPSLIAASAFHVSTSPDNTPDNPNAFVRPGSATFMNAVNSNPHVTNISGLNYSAIDTAGQLYTDRYGCDCAANYMLPRAAPTERRVIDWDNGYVGATIRYPSNHGGVEVTQEPYSRFSKLPDGSRQYDVAHVVRLYDATGKMIWETDRNQALAYRQTLA